MSLNEGQKKRLSLASTQALPAPGPAVGKIAWATASGKKNKKSLVCITHEKSPSHAVVWTIRLGDLKAIERKHAVDTKKKKIKWYVGQEVQEALNKLGEISGIAYVAEEAQTLVRLEHGVSVINSVEIATGLAIDSRETDDDYLSACDPC